MKKMYNNPETEVMDLHADKLMQSLGKSIEPPVPGPIDAPSRHLGGSLGPSY